MKKRYMQIKVKLPVDYQYSVDNGNTWIDASANSDKLIDPNELSQEKIVKVRSQNTVTALTSELFDFNSRLFKSVNIKNGKDLVTIENLFKFAVIDKLRLANLDSLENINRTFYSMNTESLNISEMPLVNTMVYSFFNANIDVVSDLNISNRKGVVLDAKGAFESLHTSIMGDVNFRAKHVNTTQNLFRYSIIKMFPFLHLNVGIGKFDGSSVANGYGRHSGIFSSCKSKYILEGLIKEQKIAGSDTSEYRDLLFGQYNYGLFESSYIKFCGLTMDMSNRDLYGSSSYPFKHINLKGLPFKSVITGKYRVTQDANNDYFFKDSNGLIDKFSNRQLSELTRGGGHVSFEKWMNDVTELEQGTNDKLIDSDSVLANGYNIEILRNGKSMESINAYGLESRFTPPTNVATSAEQVYGSRNNVRAYRNGNIVNVYNPDNTLRKSITINAESVNGCLTFNGGAMCLAVGTRYDSVAMGDQTLTGSIERYDTTDGLIKESFSVPLDTNEELTAVYKPSIESGYQIVRSKYDKDTGLKISSSVQYLYNNVYGDLVELSSPVDYVSQNYWEDNEFLCINKTDGKYIRCIGR